MAIKSAENRGMSGPGNKKVQFMGEEESRYASLGSESFLFKRDIPTEVPAALANGLIASNPELFKEVK